MNKYTGKLVFVEKIKDGNVDYNSGEYLCLFDSGNVLYCIKPGSLYEAHNQKQINLVGSGAFSVLTSSDASQVMRDSITSIEAEIARHRATKLQWIESVYSGAESAVRKMKEILAATTKPTPKLRPWKIEDKPDVLGYLIDVWTQDQSRPSLVLNVEIGGITVAGRDMLYFKEWAELFKNGKISRDHGKTWEVCGVLE